MKKSFKAFSLIEMLLTLAILMIVFLLTTRTLTTVVKVSAISKYKTLTRSETDFALELVERFLANSNIKDIYLYNSSSVRSYSEASGVVSAAPDGTYDNTPAVAPATGTEVHVRLSGYDQLTCIGFFRENASDVDSNGYLLKRTVDFDDDVNSHADCFNTALFTSSPIIVLNSESVTVKDFLVTFSKSELVNNIFWIDLTMEPLFWAPGEDTLERAVIRQSIITTQGLTWY